jgi:hypothetical protein
MIHGLISDLDAEVISKTLRLIINEFDDHKIYTTEIGIYNGRTSLGINQLIGAHGRTNVHTAIDNQKDKSVENPFPECNLIIGNSNEVYNNLKNESQHLIFVDGCHCFAHVVSDFFCYADKIKIGGYFCFHDTGRHIKEFKDFQHGDRTNPDAYISVRKALTKIGLMGFEKDFKVERIKTNDGELLTAEGFTVVRGSFPAWQLVYDIADETNEAGGICIFKKLF